MQCGLGHQEYENNLIIPWLPQHGGQEGFILHSIFCCQKTLSIDIFKNLEAGKDSNHRLKLSPHFIDLKSEAQKVKIGYCPTPIRFPRW